MLAFLVGLWGKFAGYVALAAAVLAAFAGMRYKISKSARDEMETEMRERTIERLEHAEQIKHRVDRESDDDILEKLRDNGWLRD